jgi:neutral ceramidase
MSSVTNTYSSYTTTYEEYQVQRYEGASTLYGPHTLGAYIQTAVDLATAMVKGQPVVSKVQPPNLRDQQISLLPPVLMDTVPLGTEFGDVVQDVNSSYSPGDTVEVVFRWVVRQSAISVGLDNRMYTETMRLSCWQKAASMPPLSCASCDQCFQAD